MTDFVGIRYFVTGIARFGFWDALRRWWRYHLHPRNAIEWGVRKYHRWRLLDRRNKSWPRTVFAVNRDGDFFLVECPSCHATQGPWIISGCARCLEPGPHFHCDRCDIGFQVNLEDGVVRILDHRTGVPPLPTTLVRETSGTWHLGISRDAPWWWGRKELLRDLRDGKDAHGHAPYRVWPLPQSAPEGVPEAPAR